MELPCITMFGSARNRQKVEWVEAILLNISVDGLIFFFCNYNILLFSVRLGAEKDLFEVIDSRLK